MLALAYYECIIPLNANPALLPITPSIKTWTLNPSSIHFAMTGYKVLAPKCSCPLSCWWVCRDSWHYEHQTAPFYTTSIELHFYTTSIKLHFSTLWASNCTFLHYEHRTAPFYTTSIELHFFTLRASNCIFLHYEHRTAPFYTTSIELHLSTLRASNCTFLHYEHRTAPF